MADLVLAPVLQVLFEKLASTLLRKLGNLWNLTDNFEKLQRSLVYVQSILEDAEVKQIIDRDVKTWLSELKRVIYDAEDLLDDITISDALEKKSDMNSLAPLSAFCEILETYISSFLTHLHLIPNFEFKKFECIVLSLCFFFWFFLFYLTFVL